MDTINIYLTRKKVIGGDRYEASFAIIPSMKYYLEELKTKFPDTSDTFYNGIVATILLDMANVDVRDTITELIKSIDFNTVSLKMENEIKFVINYPVTKSNTQFIDTLKPLLIQHNHVTVTKDPTVDFNGNELIDDEIIKVPHVTDDDIEENRKLFNKLMESNGEKPYDISEINIDMIGDVKMRKIEINLNEMVLPDTRYYLLDMVIKEFDEDVLIDIKHKLLSQTSGSYKSIVKFVMCHLGNDEESIIKLLRLLDNLNAAKYMIEICDDTNVHIFIESIYVESTVSNTIKLKDTLMNYNEVVFEESVLHLSYEEKQAFDDRFETRYESINEVREGIESVKRGINKSIIRNSMDTPRYIGNKESEINVNGGIDNMFEMISDAAKQVINMSISNLGMEIECELDNLVAENNDIRDIVQNGNDTRKIENTTKVTIEKLIIKVKTTINK